MRRRTSDTSNLYGGSRWDCHVHVFPRCTAPEQTLESYRLRVARPLGLDRVVLVQPSALGADHRALWDALGELGDNGRGVVALDPSATEDELLAWTRAGVRGARISPRLHQGHAETTHALLPVLAELGWHVQLYGDPDETVLLARRIAESGVAIVFDHFARIAGAETADAASREILDMLREGSAWMKLSAPYHLSASGAPYDDLRALAARVYETNPDAVVWGSDWPHPRAPHPIDAAVTLATLARWGLDHDDVDRVLSRNPAKLYAP